VTDEGTPYHHGSHRDLLESSPVDSLSGQRGIDAIFVHTARPPAYLDGAAELARSLECTLVTLHSKRWTTAADARKRLPDDLNLIAIDVKDTPQLNLPRWKTTDKLARSIFACRSDLSVKRNLAIMLSHMLGWSRILFLDDDITGLNPEDVRAAIGLLENYNAVGLHVGGFPDHSVVCHAYQMAGGKQQEFIGGGALAIAVNRTKSFFPSIYNDDWFFLLDGNDSLQPTAVTGEVVQQPYDPFRTPQRARNEELGDVLAEGIYWLLDQERRIIAADAVYWKSFLEKRRRFIEGVLRMVRADRALKPDDKTRRIDALKGSLGRLALITPELCESYLRAWADDRRQWKIHLEALPIGLSIPKALAALTRTSSSTLEYELGGEIGWTTALARLQVRYPPKSRPRSRKAVTAPAVAAAEPTEDRVAVGAGS
jgi:hypothetical protein